MADWAGREDDGMPVKRLRWCTVQVVEWGCVPTHIRRFPRTCG
jgi:hypothetical protein